MPLETTFTGEGEAPQVASAAAETARRVRVTFSEPMTRDAALANAASYTITPDGGSSARTVLSATPEGFTATPSYVLLELDGDLSIGVDNYNVAVSDAVLDAAGNALDAAHDTADFSGTHGTLAFDHCALAKARLAWQFHEKTNIEALVCAIGDRVSEVELALEDWQAFRSLGSAFGAQLDGLGTLVRLPRNGLADAAYRVRLIARAQVIQSRGRPDELIAILTTLDDAFAPAEIHLTDSYPACVLLHCLVPDGEQPSGEAFAGFLMQSKPAGVKIILEFEEEGVTLFSWAVSGDDPAPPANSGFAETDGGNGGRWAEAVGSDRWRRAA